MNVVALNVDPGPTRSPHHAFAPQRRSFLSRAASFPAELIAWHGGAAAAQDVIDVLSSPSIHAVSEAEPGVLRFAPGTVFYRGQEYRPAAATAGTGADAENDKERVQEASEEVAAAERLWRTSARWTRLDEYRARLVRDLTEQPAYPHRGDAAAAATP